MAGTKILTSKVGEEDAIRVSARVLGDLIKAQIKQGILVPGQHIIEADIVREMGASRSKVREALRRLEADGSVTIEEFRGAFVRRLTRAEVNQISRTREMLEGLAARLVTERKLTSIDQRKLHSLQRELDEAAKVRQLERYVRANDSYHTFFIANCANEFVEAFLERLRVPIFRLQFRSLFAGDAMFERNDDHHDITKAVIKGDAEGAERAMRNHVRNGTLALQSFDDSFFA